ncbi:MAG: lipid A-modifier LpxR family protein [Bacteroidota bacterium]
MTDQDFFFPPKNKDRNYTMGVSIGVSGPCWDKNSRVFPWLRKQVDKAFFMNRLHKNSKGKRYISGMQLVDGAFTPRDIGNKNVIDTDRPFGNIFGVMQSRTTTFVTGNGTDENTSLTTRFGVGLLGLRIAESVQSWIHKNITPERDIPKGWPNQISDGGELTLLYQVQYNHLIYEDVNDHNPVDDPWVEKYLQATWMAEGNVGWYTNAAAGLGLRVGGSIRLFIA